ncbi:hypothetical protein [Sinorhizobium fredii]|uniref:hypothetical protein n=1 Tax=Rhizobium fredii TaxID=380 RepID=UPI0004BC0CDA|nr:hypothetical protein [Sinorhizobium fredii]
MIVWQKGTHLKRREGKVSGNVVAEIFTQGRTHKPSQPSAGVYSVVVLGQELSETFRYLHQAEAAGQMEYDKRSR